VQAHKKQYGNRLTEEIKKDLRDAKQSGCDGVVFTGGEVTIRKDLIELVSYAKELGFDRIQLQSNHRMLAFKDQCVRLIEAGANEFSPALHGHIPELHDYLTRAPGSFKQTVRAIRNLRELNQYIITNTVVVKPNYRHMPDIARLLVHYKVDQFQFAFMHAVGNAMTNYDQMMPWISLASPFIKKGLQIGIDNRVKVMAEAMTPCTLQGYERYCSEGFIPETEIRDVVDYDPSYEDTRKNHGKVKFPQCKVCMYDEVCEGPWKEYPEKRGSDEFVAIS
jgi:MoaA/NifB/PqqE/SkfB family radical SAM enzyme